MRVANSPPLHILLDIEEILELDAPGLTWSRLEHEATKLGVEHRSSLALSRKYSAWLQEWCWAGLTWSLHIGGLAHHHLVQGVSRQLQELRECPLGAKKA